ncbi:MAG: KpsF/GutQ family sugar-phosphate isomerase [bacterium]|nr:KpsF/GutQ family sugar-phosphate isomerase [bacterium]
MTDIRKCAKEVIKIEAGEILALADKLDENFDQAVATILACKGRVIVAGMGKSGLIGKKIVATFNSTGISSFFLHPAEAMHGDLGLIQSSDILMLISKSGNIEEMESLLVSSRRMGVKLIALCGTLESELYRRADITLNCSVTREACPNNLVPTSSSTAALVMGDALAVALLRSRDFTAEDFAVLHPGGSLGRRLLLRISDLHHTGDNLPIIDGNASTKEMLLEMTSKRMGCVATVDPDGHVSGIFTDGDLRRMIENGNDFYNRKASEVMMPQPKTVRASAILDQALAIMEKYTITQLLTVDDNDRLAGIIHLHDILKSKLV